MARRHGHQTKPEKRSDAEFSATYELTSLMSEEAVSLLNPGGASNPAYLAATVSLAGMLGYIFVTRNDANVMLTIAWAGVCFALIFMGSHWRDRQQKRLAQCGLDAVRLPQDGRRFTVDVWRDRVEVTDPTGQMTVYPLQDLRRVYASEKMIELSMADGALVLIPRKALSLQRFNACLRLLQDAAPRHGLPFLAKKGS